MRSFCFDAVLSEDHTQVRLTGDKARRGLVSLPGGQPFILVWTPLCLTTFRFLLWFTGRSFPRVQGGRNGERSLGWLPCHSLCLRADGEREDILHGRLQVQASEGKACRHMELYDRRGRRSAHGVAAMITGSVSQVTRAEGRVAEPRAVFQGTEQHHLGVVPRTVALLFRSMGR